MDHLLTTYGEAIEALFARTTGDTKLGLGRTQALLSRLDSPQLALSALHVAGTNGKGSVVATAEALLRARGQRVGRYTSPHLIDFRERITINGRPISKDKVLTFLQRWTPTAEDLGATFFELTTALALSWFAEQSVDVAVIETGVGGRLDSTNVITPKVAAVTSIGWDHTDLLGFTLPEIAREKAGIFKRGAAAVIGEPQRDIRDLLVKAARHVGASPVIVIDDAYRIEAPHVSEQGTGFTLQRARQRAEVRTPLIGRHQARNTAIAIAAVGALDPEYYPDLTWVSSALESVFLPGRFQRSGKFILDVAHNPAGARALADTLLALKPPAPRTAVLAVLADKDWRGIIRELSPAVDRFIFTTAPSATPERAWNPAAAQVFAREEGYVSDVEPDLDHALSRAEKRSASVIVTGSFHTVGDTMSRLQVSPFAA